ncbi:MAG: hypothetical protein FWD57_14005, partial [Polyangiaceae bacterium]|nr:hypothetical protein [Polyangiaceae bacterium]
METLKFGIEMVAGNRKRFGIRRNASVAFAIVGLCACGVESPDNTGGADLEEGECGRGVVVVQSDYVSTNVSLLSIDGLVLSSSMISSGTTAPGLSAALGGDVVVPSSRNVGADIVLIDRYPSGVLTWVDIESGVPVGQLSVANGFYSNPRDYLQLSATKAYVSRYNTNDDSGMEQFDEGGDVLVVDPRNRVSVGRISMDLAMGGVSHEQYWPRADKLLEVGSDVAVLLGMYSPDFGSSAASRVARLNPRLDVIEQTLVLEGMHGCTSMAISPSGEEIAVGCSGQYSPDLGEQMVESGIVILSVKGVWGEVRRFRAVDFGMGPIGDSVSYGGDGVIVFTTTGALDSDWSVTMLDSVVVASTLTGEFSVVLRSEGVAFALGSVGCASGCGVCFSADSS